MHIILEDDFTPELAEKYTLLKVDTIKFAPEDDPIQAYVVLEDIPVEEISKIPEFGKLHDKLVENYQKKNWNFCEQAIEHLYDRWGKQMNTYYDEISSRIAKYKDEDPGENWDPALKKY